MRTQSVDTRPEAEEVLISLFQKASTAKKFSQIRSLSQTTFQLSRRAIARANKDLTERQIDIIFVSYHYGDKIANNLKKYLDRIEHENS
jgi:vacuolar-type H+-ATPase subunit F/Vma7